MDQGQNAINQNSQTTCLPLTVIDYNSDAYHQAALLRYELFYKVHGISFENSFAPTEARDLHLAIVDSKGDRPLAYGRLGQNSPHEFQMYQNADAS